MWVGTPNDPRNERVVRNICLRPAGETKGCSAGRYGSVFGATIAAPIWKAIMDRALEGAPKTPFAEPGTAITDGEKVDIPDISRRSLDDAKALLLQSGFVPSVTKVYSNYRVGTVVGTSPRGQATRGSVVKVLVSQGPAPEPSAPPPDAPPAG